MKLNLVIPPIFPVGKPKSQHATTNKKPIGWWRVTTEGDVEGRSVKFIGDYFGHVAEIALSVPDIPYYCYRFEPLNRPPIAPVTYTAVRKEAPICISFAPCKFDDSTLKWYRSYLDAPEIDVFRGDCYANIMVAFPRTAEEIEKENEELRRKAIAKLTSKEIAALGISSK